MTEENTRRDDSNHPARRDAGFPDEYAPADDEISLYDLWNVLDRRRYVLFGIFLLVVVLGTVYAMTRESVFEYRSAVEIGTLETADGEEQLLEAPATVRSRLQDAIIPATRAQMAEERESVPQVSLAGGGDSSVIVLSSTAPTGRSELVNDVHDRVVEGLEEVHDRLTESRREDLLREKASLEDELAFIQDERVLAAQRDERRRAIEAAEDQIEDLEAEREETVVTLESEIAQAQREVEGIDSQKARLRARQERLDDREELLAERVAATESMLADLRQTRAELVTEAPQDGVLGLFLGSTEIDSVQTRLNELVEERRFGIPEERDDLAQSLDELTQQRETLQNTIMAKQTELDNVEAATERQIREQRRIIREQETALERMEAEREADVDEKQSEIEGVAADLDELAPTRATFVGVQSLQPAGTSKSLILVLSVVLGGMLGVFGAFFWEFISNARRYRRSEATG